MSKLLKDLDFTGLINKNASLVITEAGKDIIDNYRAYLFNNEESHTLVNRFIAECSKASVAHDTGLSTICNYINAYITEHKIGWQLGSICESLSAAASTKMNSYASMTGNVLRSINEAINSYSEDELISQIKKGAFRQGQFIPEVRHICESVYNKQATDVNRPDYSISNPVCYVSINESEDRFVRINKKTFKISHDGKFNESICSDDKFNKINMIIESMMNITKDAATGNVLLNTTYRSSAGFTFDFIIAEDKVTVKTTNRMGKTTSEVFESREKFLEHCGKLSNMLISGSDKFNLSGIYGNVAQVYESIDDIFVLDNVKLLQFNPMLNAVGAVVAITESGSEVNVTVFDDMRNGKSSENFTSVNEALQKINSLYNVDLSNLYRSQLIAETATDTIKKNEGSVVEAAKEFLNESLKNTETMLEARKKAEERPSNIEKLLESVDFHNFINNIEPVTEAARSFVNNYKSYLISNPASYTLVNGFLSESKRYGFDTELTKAVNELESKIVENRISWKLASACESLAHNNSPYNYIAKTGIERVEKLLEMREQDVISYIKAGSLKSVQYIPEFRTVCKEVYRDSMLDKNLNMNGAFKANHPISFVSFNESVNEKGETDLEQFISVCGTTYKINNDNIVESICDDKTFIFMNEALKNFTISENENETVYETRIKGINHDTISMRIKSNNDNATIGVEYKTLSETKNESFDNVQSFKEWSRVMSKAILNVNEKMQFMNACDMFAKVYENINYVFAIDNVNVVECAADNAIYVIAENKDNVMLKIVQHPRNVSHAPAYCKYIIEAVNQIIKLSGVNVSELYNDRINEDAKKMAADNDETELKEAMKASRNEQIAQRKKKISMLAEKYKDDPARIAVLNNIAKELKMLED